MKVTRAVLPLLLAPTLLGQTFVVDAAGGPGTQFSDIATAIAAVPDGATLVVRAGNYARFAISDKSLAILAEPNVTIAPDLALTPITIGNLSANKRVVLRGMKLHHTVVCSHCDGRLLFEDLEPANLSFGLCALSLTDCDQVVVRGGWLNAPGAAALLADHSRVVVDGSFLPAMIQTSVRAVAAEVQLVGVTPPGLLLIGDPASTFWLLGATTFSGSVLLGPRLRIADTVTVAPTSSIQASSLLIVPDRNATADGGALGSPLHGTLRGADGELALLTLGAAGNAVELPGVAGSWWLDLTQLGVAAAGVLSGPLTVSAQVPNNPSLRGQLFGFQGLHLDAALQLSASSPAWFVLH